LQPPSPPIGVKLRIKSNRKGIEKQGDAIEFPFKKFSDQRKLKPKGTLCKERK
jgi:hypothetical protein